MYVDTKTKLSCVSFSPNSPVVVTGLARICIHTYPPSWPLQDIAITNIVWWMAYKRGVAGGAYIAQWSCNSIAIG